MIENPDKTGELADKGLPGGAGSPDTSKTANRWSRSDIISAFAALVAVAALVLPYAIHWWQSRERPKVTIVTPSNNTTVANNTFSVSGTAQHIPQGDDLWLIVRGGIQGRWFPAQLITVSDSRWVIRKDMVCPAWGVQDLVIFMIPINNDQQLFAYKIHRRQERGKSIASLPPSAVVEATATIQVPNNEPAC